LSVFNFAGPRYSGNFAPSNIAEGRGADLPSTRQNERELLEIEDGNITEGNIYLNCEGNVIAGCDWSYESQRDPRNIISTTGEFSAQKVEEFIANA
jgi:hypothetical protein